MKTSQANCNFVEHISKWNADGCGLWMRGTNSNLSHISISQIRSEKCVSVRFGIRYSAFGCAALWNHFSRPFIFVAATKHHMFKLKKWFYHCTCNIGGVTQCAHKMHFKMMAPSVFQTVSICMETAKMCRKSVDGYTVYSLNEYFFRKCIFFLRFLRLFSISYPSMYCLGWCVPPHRIYTERTSPPR